MRDYELDFEQISQAGQEIMGRFAPAFIKENYRFATADEMRQRMAPIRQALEGESIKALAVMEPQARALLTRLRADPEMEMYADWLETRMDFLKWRRKRIGSFARRLPRRLLPRPACLPRRLLPAPSVATTTNAGTNASSQTAAPATAPAPAAASAATSGAVPTRANARHGRGSESLYREQGCLDAQAGESSAAGASRGLGA